MRSIPKPRPEPRPKPGNACRIMLAMAAMAAGLLPPPALANSGGANGGESPFSDNLPSGSFITSRPVSPRAAEVPPMVPEPPNHVVMGGKEETLLAVEMGLKPLSDDEQSAVAAETAADAGLMPQMLDQAFNSATETRNMQAGALVQEHLGSATNTIRQAMGVLPSAIGALRNVLGDGQ